MEMARPRFVIGTTAPPRFTTIDGSGLPARVLCDVCGISVLRDREREFGPRRCAKHREVPHESDSEA